MVFQITAKLNKVRGPHTHTVLHRSWWNVALIAVSRDLPSSSSSLSLSLPRSSHGRRQRSATGRLETSISWRNNQVDVAYTSGQEVDDMETRRLVLFTGVSSPSRATCPYSQGRRTQRMRQWSLHGRSFAGLRHYELGGASGFRNCPI